MFRPRGQELAELRLELAGNIAAAAETRWQAILGRRTAQAARYMARATRVDSRRLLLGGATDKPGRTA